MSARDGDRLNPLVTLIELNVRWDPVLPSPALLTLDRSRADLWLRPRTLTMLNSRGLFSIGSNAEQ
jgi:hypothetical protein